MKHREYEIFHIRDDYRSTIYNCKYLIDQYWIWNNRILVSSWFFNNKFIINFEKIRQNNAKKF